MNTYGSKTSENSKLINLAINTNIPRLSVNSLHERLPVTLTPHMYIHVWQWKLSFGTKCWKAFGNRVRNVIEISKIEWVTTKPCNGKTASRAKKFHREGSPLDLPL